MNIKMHDFGAFYVVLAQLLRLMWTKSILSDVKISINQNILVKV